MSKSTLRNLIISLSLLVIVGVVTLFFFLDLLKSSQTLEEQISALAIQEQQQAALIRLQKIAQSSEPDRAELASYFLLRESDHITFLSEVESIAPIMGIEIKEIGLQEVQEDNRSWIETAFSIRGARESVKSFVNVLETVPYVSRVTQATMKSADRGMWEADIVIQVQLLSYD